MFFSPPGKSMLLAAISHREVPIPEHIDIYHLTREMVPSEKTALQCVMEVDEQRIKLEKEAERLAHEDCELQASLCTINQHVAALFRAPRFHRGCLSVTASFPRRGTVYSSF